MNLEALEDVQEEPNDGRRRPNNRSPSAHEAWASLPPEEGQAHGGPWKDRKFFRVSHLVRRLIGTSQPSWLVFDPSSVLIGMW